VEFFIIKSMARVKRNGDRMQPCFTQVLTLKVSESCVADHLGFKVAVQHCKNLDKLCRDSIVPRNKETQPAFKIRPLQPVTATARAHRRQRARHRDTWNKASNSGIIHVRRGSRPNTGSRFLTYHQVNRVRVEKKAILRIS
jgi:hypothetical protein